MSAERPVPTAAIGARRVPLLNIANALTAARIVLVPVFVLFTLASGMTHPGWRVAACVAFGIASVTDYVDGWIARTYDLVTSFGKVADPIADKALTGAALLLLSGYGRLPWWMTVVILAREVGVTALRLWVIRRGVIPASRGGKIKTVLQLLGIGWLLLPLPTAVSAAGVWVMLAAVVVTVATGLDYVLRALRLHRTVAAAPAPTAASGTAVAAAPGSAAVPPTAAPPMTTATPEALAPLAGAGGPEVVLPLAGAGGPDVALPLAGAGGPDVALPLAEPVMPAEPGAPPEVGLAGGRP